MSIYFYISKYMYPYTQMNITLTKRGLHTQQDSFMVLVYIQSSMCRFILNPECTYYRCQPSRSIWLNFLQIFMTLTLKRWSFADREVLVSNTAYPMLSTQEKLQTVPTDRHG